MASNLPTNPGLSFAQVAERVARGESNDYKIRVGRTYWQIIRDNVLNLFNIILLILLVTMLAYGDVTNVLFASFSVILNTIVGLVQETSAKRALDKLAALSVQQVKVWRDGQLTDVPVTLLVKDDVMPIEPGDRIAVDGQTITADSLEMDESLLTGESDAILKEVGATLFSGSFCVAGGGLMVATQVGANSTINKLSQTAKAYRNVLTPTQMRINAVVQVSILGMLLFSPMLLIAGIAQRLPDIEKVRNLLVLVTSFVPQGLVLATTVSLTLGALRISRHQTLVQRVNAVESMANVDVLCFDKTGTLTKNQLAVVEILPLDRTTTEQLHAQLRRYTTSLSHQNKTAAAIADYTAQIKDTVAVNGTAKQLEIPFSSARKWGAIVFDHETLILGAPERVLDPVQSKDTLAQARKLASEGQRVLAFAHAPQPPQDKTLGERQPLALIVMSDQVRQDIRETLTAFRQQNVQLKVISGDNIETVTTIAAQAGMDVSYSYTGEQIEAMTPPELLHATAQGSVFARIEPETKRKIIRALRQQGHYVAMVGDGVNDVPALKEANMAIAMNDGAQIAKDVADVVLLNNAMSTLPLAFAEGAKITQKILGTTKLFLTKNFFTILAFIFVGFMTLPFPSNPIQISWFTFGIVNIPAILITFDVIHTAWITDFGEVIRYVAVATLVGAIGAAILYAFVIIDLTGIPRVGRPLRTIIEARDTARSALFIFMCLYGLIFTWNTFGVYLFGPRSFMQRPKVALFGLATCLITILVAFIPQFRLSLFTFIEPSEDVWVLILGVFVATVLGLYYALRNYGGVLRFINDITEDTSSLTPHP